ARGDCAYGDRRRRLRGLPLGMLAPLRKAAVGAGDRTGSIRGWPQPEVSEHRPMIGGQGVFAVSDDGGTDHLEVVTDEDVIDLPAVVTSLELVGRRPSSGRKRGTQPCLCEHA